MRGWVGLNRIGCCVALSVSTVLAASAATEGPREERGVVVARCDCPCELSCGNGVTCKCESGESGRTCNCGSVSASTATLRQLLAEPTPEVHAEYASWFDAAPIESITVAIEAAHLETGGKTSWRLDLVPSEKSAHVFVPDDRFDGEQYARWRSRVDTAKPGWIVFAATGDDPGLYRIKDGDLSHLNESLRKRFSLATGSGPLVLFSSDSTLAWEMRYNMRSAVTCLDPKASTGSLDDVRHELYGWIDTIDVLIKASDFDGAVAVLDRVEIKADEVGMDRRHPDTERLIREARVTRDLLRSGATGKPETIEARE